MRYDFFLGDAARAETIFVAANSRAAGKNLAAGTYVVHLYAFTKTSDPFLFDARFTGGRYLKPAVQGFAVEQDDWSFAAPNACDKVYETWPGYGIDMRGQIVTQENICPREFTFSRSGSVVRKVMVTPNDPTSATVTLPSGTYDVVRQDACPAGVQRPRRTWEREVKVMSPGWRLVGD